MIGLPTDFQHTIHIGSNDIELNNTAVRALQNQMQSKGGYETSYTALKVGFAKNVSTNRRLRLIYRALKKKSFVCQFRW